MGFIRLEKDRGRQDSGKFFNTYDSSLEEEMNQYQGVPDVSKTSDVVASSINTGMYLQPSMGDLNTGSEDYAYDFEADHEKDTGMDEGKIKVERDVITTCLSTFIKVVVMSCLLLVLLYLGFLYLDSKVELFPYQSSYTAIEFNEYLRRSIILMFLLLAFGCSIFMILMTNVVTKQFKRHYLTKFSVYVYDVFTSFINFVIYCVGAWCMFQVVDGLYEKFVFWEQAGTIVGSVNIETINIFKYVITSVVAVFIVINTFSIVGIVHKNNKFAFDEI